MSSTFFIILSPLRGHLRLLNISSKTNNGHKWVGGIDTFGEISTLLPVQFTGHHTEGKHEGMDHILQWTRVQCRPVPSYVQWSMWLHCPQIMQSVGHAWLHLWMTLPCCQHNNRENGLSTDLSMCFHFSYTLDVLNCSQKIHVYSAALCFNADDRVQEVRPKETFFGMPVPTAFLLTTSLLNRYDSCCQSPTARIFLRLLIKHFCSD